MMRCLKVLDSTEGRAINSLSIHTCTQGKAKYIKSIITLSHDHTWVDWALAVLRKLRRCRSVKNASATWSACGGWSMYFTEIVRRWLVGDSHHTLAHHTVTTYLLEWSMMRMRPMTWLSNLTRSFPLVYSISATIGAE